MGGESLALFDERPAIEVSMSRRGHLLYETAAGGTACFSADRAYRYWLTRRWEGGEGIALWWMLNPSKAGALQGDLTVAKIVGFSKLLGARESCVVNHRALVSTDPAALLEHPDPTGPLNDDSIRGALLSAKWVIAAWGGHESVTAERVDHARAMLRGREVLCLGRTKSGAPRHPSRLAYATPFETLWEATRS